MAGGEGAETRHQGQRPRLGAEVLQRSGVIVVVDKSGSFFLLTENSARREKR